MLKAYSLNPCAIIMEFCRYGDLYNVSTFIHSLLRVLRGLTCVYSSSTTLLIALIGLCASRSPSTPLRECASFTHSLPLFFTEVRSHLTDCHVVTCLTFRRSQV